MLRFAFCCWLFSLYCLGLIACSSPEPSTTLERPESPAPNAADSLLRLIAIAHGVDQLDDAIYSFTFRDKRYSFNIDNESFSYAVEYSKNDTTFIDAIKHHSFSRTVNGQQLTLSKKQRDSGFESLNSVLYFATLPHRLTDKAVLLDSRPPISINGIPYNVLAVTFAQEGGGTDFEDEYRYWINGSTHRIDFLAYNYKVNKGGVRFREAFNSRRVGETVFQDYNNFKSPVGTPLDSLPALFQRGQLELLSQILTEDVSLTSSKSN